MKKTIFSIFAAVALCCSLSAQDSRQRTVETIVQDVMAALPAQDMAACNEQMADLAKAAPASVVYLASRLQPAEARSNNIVEYALSGVVRYATDPSNADVKEDVMKGLEQAVVAATDKYNRQFLEAQLRLMQPFEDVFPGHMQETFMDENARTLFKSKAANDRCRSLWLLVETLGRKSQKQILSALKSDDRSVRTTALLAYADLADENFYDKVVKMYGRLSPEAKSDVIYWFGENEIYSQLPLVMSELNAGGELGSNAVEAAGKIGDRRTAESLVTMLGGNRSAEALEALKHIKTDITDIVAAAFDGADSRKASALVALACAKGNNSTSEAVIALARSEDSTLASEAREALHAVVNPSDFDVVAGMLDAAGEDVPQLAAALKSTMKQLSDDMKFEKVVAFAENAGSPENFYPVIASTDTDAAVNYLESRYRAGSDKALEALASVRNQNAALTLLEAADKNQEYLRNFVSLVSAGDFSMGTRCEYCCRALDKATDNEVRKCIIDALGDVPTMRAFATAGSYVGDPALVRNASAAVRKIASRNTAGIDYYQLKDVLGKASDYYKSTGDADDGYAADEIRKLLDSVKPYEKYQLTDEEKAQGFEILYDGTDLSKWVGDKVGYQSVNGCIEVSATYGNAQNLYTAKEYTDFVFRFEFCFLRSGVNNGVGIRTPMGVDAAYHGMCEVQVLDHDAPIYADLRPYQVHGSVYGIVPARRIVHKPLGEWSTMEIRVEGDKVKVTVNGEVINDADVRKACKGRNMAPDGSGNNPYTVDGRNHPGLFNKKGHIGFLGHGEGLKYRNVRILELNNNL